MQIFATLSPIPGFMQWLRAKLSSQIKLAETESQEGNSLEGASSTFRESILLPDEEKMIHDAMYVPFQDNVANSHVSSAVLVLYSLHFQYMEIRTG